MKIMGKLLEIMVLLSLLSMPAVGSVITFNDIDASAGDVGLDLLSPYEGLTWTNFFAYAATPGFPGFNNGIISSPTGAYSGGEIFGSAIVGAVSSPVPFDFLSAYLGAGYYDDLSVTVVGKLGGAVQYSQAVTVSTSGAQFFSFGFTGIDTLEFSSAATGTSSDPFGCGPSNCTQFTLDDITVEPTISTAVPEPSTFALLGLAVFAASIRKLFVTYSAYSSTEVKK